MFHDELEEGWRDVVGVGCSDATVSFRATQRVAGDMLPNSKVVVPTPSDVIMGAVDWLLVGYSPLLCSFRGTEHHIKALHGEHQLGLSALMGLTQGIVCRQYVGVEMVEQGLSDLLAYLSQALVCSWCAFDRALQMPLRLACTDTW